MLDRISKCEQFYALQSCVLENIFGILNFLNMLLKRKGGYILNKKLLTQLKLLSLRDEKGKKKREI